MSGKGTYLGGSTLISLRKRKRHHDDGWEPRYKIIGPATSKKTASVKGEKGAEEAWTFCPEIGRDATAFEIAAVRFARQWAKSNYDTKNVPPIPEIIRQRYGSRLDQYLKTIRKTKFGKKMMKTGAAKPSNG